MTFGAPYPLDLDAIAEWNAANKRAREAYNPATDMCADCGVLPRYGKATVCNPCRYKRDAARKAKL